MAERGASGRVGASRAALLLGSVLLHAALLVLLARYLTQTQAYGEPPAMQVSLTPMSPPRPEREAAPRERPPGRAGAAPPVLSAPALAGGPAPLLSGEAMPGADEDAAARQALGGLRGCDRPGLTRDERERCEARRWTGGATADPRLNLDPSGRYAENPEAFLSRRPTRGCRARVTGDVGPFGDDQNARAGVTCVKPF